MTAIAWRVLARGATCLLFLAAPFHSTQAASTNEASSGKVATVTPISHTLSVSLLSGTHIEVDYLPPNRLPVNRIASWLRKNRTKQFDAYDAFISIGDALPAFAFSSTLRQTNIRLVTIDVAYARLPEGERVVLGEPDEFFWLNTNNLLLMLGILKRDLALLWPEHRPRINANYQSASAAIRRLSLDIESLLFDNEIAVLAFDKTALKPLTDSLPLDVVSQEEALAMAELALRVGSARSKASAADANQQALRYWRIDDLSRFSDQSIEDRLAENLRALQSLFE
ncbi:MAG: hypothetical protein AAF515_13280 [Pseudomonadota bacterium]